METITTITKFRTFESEKKYFMFTIVSTNN